MVIIWKWSSVCGRNWRKETCRGSLSPALSLRLITLSTSLLSTKPDSKLISSEKRSLFTDVFTVCTQNCHSTWRICTQDWWTKDSSVAKNSIHCRDRPAGNLQKLHEIQYFKSRFKSETRLIDDHFCRPASFCLNLQVRYFYLEESAPKSRVVYCCDLICTFN